MSELLRIYPDHPQPRSIQRAVEVLKAGGLIIYPTDTVYTLGCDFSSAAAMEKVARLRGLKVDKAQFSIVCSDLSHLSQYTKSIDTATFRLLKAHLPGPFTFILEAGKGLPTTYKGKKTVGIRVPDHSVPQLLVQELGNPIISTSIRDEDEILEYTTDPELIAEKFDGQVDLILDAGAGGNLASTIVDLTSGSPEILRQGKGEL